MALLVLSRDINTRSKEKLGLRLKPTTLQFVDCSLLKDINYIININELGSANFFDQCSLN